MTEAMPQYLMNRRGRLYFRRRIGGFSTRINAVTLPLGTTDRQFATKLVMRLSVELDRMLISLSDITPPLPADLVARYVENCLRHHLREIKKQNLIAKMGGTLPGTAQWRADMHTRVLQMLLEDGPQSRLPIHLIEHDWTKEQLSFVTDLYASECKLITDPRALVRIGSRLADVTDLEIQTDEQRAQMLEATLKARHRAISELRDQTVANTPLAPLASSKFAHLGQDDLATNVSSDIPPISSLPKENMTIAVLREQMDLGEQLARAQPENFTTDLAGIFWRMALADQFSEDTIEQRTASLRLFMYTVGVVDVLELKQWHMRRFVDVMGEIPKSFLRSVHDQHRPLPETLTRAKMQSSDKVGLAAASVKKHLKTLELLIQRAQAEGHKVDVVPDLSSLRPKIKGKAHKRRPVFKFDELRRVFSHCLWQGHRSPGRRHEHGNVIVQDGRYWIPLLLAYSGARRAEVAALLVDDIGVDADIPIITIQFSEYRGIKGESRKSLDPREKLTRIVPIHSHLIELGFLDYAERLREQGQTFLFPDVVPTSRTGHSKEEQAKNTKKFGRAIVPSWEKSLDITLDQNPRKLCMHSLRHYVNHTLIHAPDVHEVTRYDLLGHVESGEAAASRGNSVNVSVYRDETPLTIKAHAIEKIPRLF